MLMTRSTATGLRIATDQRRAARSAPFREGGNDAPRCPSIYRGFEEPPKIPHRSVIGTQDACTLERRLRTREQDIHQTFRERKDG
jgi:hypothetical protein